MGNQQWLESPPGLTKIKPLKRTKVQQEATQLLWTTLPEDTQTKIQALGIEWANQTTKALPSLNRFKKLSPR